LWTFHLHIHFTQPAEAVLTNVSPKRIHSLFIRLVADGWCWFVLREKYCWLVGDSWFVLREKYRWLVADKPNEQEGEVPFLFTVR
jgi:hypothetical protein